MGTPRQVVLLCAEDDDLALVGVVHLGRQLGLELEVVTDLECDDGPFLDAIDDCDRGLFAIVRSAHLCADRALQLKSTFAIARREELEIVTLRLTRDPQETLTPVLRRLARIDDWEPEPIPDAATGRFPSAPLPAATPAGSGTRESIPTNAPLGPVLQLDPPEQSVTLSGRANDATARNPIVGGAGVDPEDEFLVVPRRTRPGAWFVGLSCAALVGAGLWWQMNPAEPERPQVVPEVRVVEAAAVPPDEDDLPEPSPPAPAPPASPRTSP